MSGGFQEQSRDDDALLYGRTAVALGPDRGRGQDPECQSNVEMWDLGHTLRLGGHWFGDGAAFKARG